MLRIAVVAVALAVLPPCRLAAWQCPDGAPPPCRGAASARRPAPPLDDRTWIVVPFENVANVADIDWLKNASVNLLYLDMSKWRDIRVIDDERVADLIREVPEARGSGALTLQSGMAVARRAGAGKLVMGDLLKVGSRTQVVAKVFDVRTGLRLRSVRGETSNADSLMAVFGRLARGILNADPPAGSSLGTVGTTSLEAYRAYVAGLAALNRVVLDSAQALFTDAIRLDSSFALAHYKLSVVYGWLNPGDRSRRTHADAANRFSAGLPPRERALITGQLQTSASRWGEACATYAGLLRNDSSDVEAWYNLGECNYHDQFIAVGSDSVATFRGSWNTAMRAFLRALELDPTYHLAYSHLPDILLVETRNGCVGQDVVSACTQALYVAVTLREADSLVHRPATDLVAQSEQRRLAVRQNVWRTNVAQNRAYAQAWANAGPGEPRAHLALARALMRAGQPAEAAREYALTRGAIVSIADANRALMERFELLMKLDSVAVAARMADSLAAVNDTGPMGVNAAFASVLLGRHRRIDAIFRGFTGPPPVLRFLKGSMLAMQGAPPADLVALELGYDSMLASVPEPQRTTARTTLLMAGGIWTMDLVRPPALQALDTSSGDVRTAAFAWAMRRDTLRVRQLVVRLDSAALASPRELPSAFAFQGLAELYLFLGDTATALARLREWDARFPFLNPTSVFVPNFGNLTVNIQTWGRTWLRLADLSAARGDAPTAIRNYRRVVDLWQNADAPFQPLVQRARAALARLGG